jgi:UvrD/REP helicase N-terminal domain
LPEHAERFTSMTFDSFTKSIVDRFKDLLPPAWAISGTYRIGFASQVEVRDFLGNLAAGAPEKFRSGLYGIRQAGFITNLVGSYRLEPEPQEPATAQDYAIQRWWAQKYQAHDVLTVDFVMLNRLAELVIRSSPQLQRALTATYPYVFVDEFQDTTYAQYSFLKSVFAREGTTVTVVGDGKQRIMGWAGALTDAFAEFEHDFDAQPFELTWNFRSTQELVKLQHRFATRLDPDSQQQLSQVVSQVGEPPVQVWSFSNARLEAESIAAWIAADIEQSERPPAEYALIARQRVADLEPELAPALAAQGLKLRNERRPGRRAPAPGSAQGRARATAHRPDPPRRCSRRPAANVARGHRHADPARSERREPRSGVEHRRLTRGVHGPITQLVRSYSLDNDATTGPVIDLTEELAEALADKLTAFVKYDDIAQKRILAITTGNRTRHYSDIAGAGWQFD